MSGFEYRRPVADVAAGRNADAADLRGQGIGDVVAVQIQRGNDVVFFRAHQRLLQKVVGDHILDHDLGATARTAERQPRTCADLLRTELVLRQLVTPVAEGAFGVFHDVALVHQRHRDPIVVDRVLDGLTHQALTALLRYRLDADAGTGREADFAHVQLVLQVIDELVHLGVPAAHSMPA